MSEPTADPGAAHLRQVTAMLPEDIEPSADLGPLPIFAWIPKEWCVIDERYQRRVDDPKARALITRIVETFAWDRFAPVTVAQLQDGPFAAHYVVVDGQRRAVAAMRHPLVTEIPAWVIEAPEVRTQAKAFVGINADRQVIQPLHVYRAELTAGLPDAVQVDGLLARCGVEVVFHLKGGRGELSPRSTQAVVTVRKLIARHGEGPVETSLKVLTEAYPEKPGQLRGQIIDAVTALLLQEPEMDRARLARALAKKDCEQLIGAARAYKLMAGGSTSAGMLDAMKKAYEAEPVRPRATAAPLAAEPVPISPRRAAVAAAPATGDDAFPRPSRKQLMGRR